MTVCLRCAYRLEYCWGSDSLPDAAAPAFHPCDLDSCRSQVIEASKMKFEDALTERTEGLVSDIEKLKNRVRELDDLGDVNNTPLYVSDMRALRRKLTELEGVVEWINEQETLFKFPVSSYPEIHQLQVGGGTGSLVGLSLCWSVLSAHAISPMHSSTVPRIGGKVQRPPRVRYMTWGPFFGQ